MTPLAGIEGLQDGALDGATGAGRLQRRSAPPFLEQRVGLGAQCPSGPVADEPLAIAEEWIFVLARGSVGPSFDDGRSRVVGPGGELLEQDAGSLWIDALAVPVGPGHVQASPSAGERDVTCAAL